jgi:hypothetical protein
MAGWRRDDGRGQGERLAEARGRRHAEKRIAVAPALGGAPEGGGEMALMDVRDGTNAPWFAAVIRIKM